MYDLHIRKAVFACLLGQVVLFELACLACSFLFNQLHCLDNLVYITPEIDAACNITSSSRVLIVCIYLIGGPAPENQPVCMLCVTSQWETYFLVVEFFFPFFLGFSVVVLTPSSLSELLMESGDWGAMVVVKGRSTSANQPPPRHSWTVLAGSIDYTEVYSNVPNCLDLDKSL